MSDALIKKGLFDKALSNAELDHLFEEFQSDDVYYYKANQNIKNGRATLWILFDDTIFSVGKIVFSQLEDAGKKEKILRLFNEMNNQYKSKKYTIDDDGELTLSISYISGTNDFNAELFLDLFIHTFKSLEDNDYPKIMRVLWA